MTSIWDHCGLGGGGTGTASPPVATGTTAPATPSVGDLWLDTSTVPPVLKVLSAPNTWTPTSPPATAFHGAVDVTAPYVAPAPGSGLNPGDFGIVQTAGTADPSWAAVGVVGYQDPDDLLIWDGSKFHVVEHGVDLRETVDVRTATAGQTTLTLARVPAHSTAVELNGASLVPSTDYTRTGADITFTSPLKLGDSITIRYF